MNYDSGGGGGGVEWSRSGGSEDIDHLDWDSQFDWERPVSDLGPVDGSIGRNKEGQKVRLRVTPDDFHNLFGPQ